MKFNLYCTLIASGLILACGCKKPLNNSVKLSNGAKAGFAANTGWQMPGIYGRLARYDINDGNNSDCILAYDVYYGTVSLTQFNATNSTTLYGPVDGFATDNEGTIDVNNWWSDITDNYNEVGGVHIIPYDATGSGHEDHLLLYIPLRGVACLLHYTGVGSTPWHVDWQNGTTSGPGIGGYNLAGIYDKIITYDYGTGEKNYLMLYRPGSGILWVLQNNTTPSNPDPAGGITWTPRIQSNGGIGGYDLKNVSDQLVVIGGPAHDYMDLAAFRPGYGNVWFLYHAANSVNWSAGYSTSSGLNGFGLDKQDRIATGSDGGVLVPASVVPENDANSFFYRPGPGLGAVPTCQAAFYQWPGSGNPGAPTYPTFSGFGTNSSQLLLTNPYANSTNAGDHVLFFTGYGGNYNISMLFYTPGASKQSQLYYPVGEAEATGANYYEVY